VSGRTRFPLALAVCALIAISGATPLGRAQAGPVTEPRSAQHESAPLAKGARAITERREKCTIRLIVNADALFQPHRWTLNYDATETLDVLGPLIMEAGNHPTRIVASTRSSDSAAENLDVGRRRAITVRSWLINRHFVDASATTEAVKQSRPMAASEDTPGEKNGTVEVMVDTCH